MTREQEFRKQTEEAKFESFAVMCKKVAVLEKENAELKEQNGKLLESCAGATMIYKDLCKAKGIIKKFLLWENDWHSKTESKYELLKQAEQLLKEADK